MVDCNVCRKLEKTNMAAIRKLYNCVKFRYKWERKTAPANETATESCAGNAVISAPTRSSSECVMETRGNTIASAVFVEYRGCDNRTSRDVDARVMSRPVNEIAEKPETSNPTRPDKRKRGGVAVSSMCRSFTPVIRLWRSECIQLCSAGSADQIAWKKKKEILESLLGSPELVSRVS